MVVYKPTRGEKLNCVFNVLKLKCVACRERRDLFTRRRSFRSVKMCVERRDFFVRERNAYFKRY